MMRSSKNFNSCPWPGSGVDTAAIVASTLIQFRAFYLADSTPENATAGNTASEDEAAEDMAENQEVTEA